MAAVRGAAGPLRVLAIRCRRSRRLRIAEVKTGGDDRHTYFVLQSVVGHGAEDDVRVLVGRLADDRRRVVNLMEGDVVAAGDVQQYAARTATRAPPIEESSSNGLETAICAASTARLSPCPTPVPMTAMPMSRMTV